MEQHIDNKDLLKIYLKKTYPDKFDYSRDRLNDIYEFKIIELIFDLPNYYYFKLILKCVDLQHV